MGSTAEQLEAAVLALPRGERARLAERLLASLDEETEIDAAWKREVEDRLKAYRQGKIESVPAADVIREARRNFGSNT